MHIQWDDVRLFLAIAEGGSLSRAARQLQVAQPTVSRRLADLESSLGEPLFQRGVEGASLTSFGADLVAPARRMAEWASEVERAAEKSESIPSGVVRLTASPGIAFDFVAPFAAALKKTLPKVTLEVVSTIQYLDLGRREADIALRMDRPSQRDLVCIAEHQSEVAAYASASYAAGLPKGYGFGDVDWIGWAPPFEHIPPNPQLARLVPGFRPAFACDDYLVQISAASAGVGAIVLSRTRHPFSRLGELVELELELGPVTAGLYLVSTKSALAIPRVRAVADALEAELRRATVPPKRRAKKTPSGDREPRKKQR